MQRRLVLTNEGAGHPIRRILPPPPAPPRRDTTAGDNDVRLFFLSFGAFFVSFSTMFF